MNIFIVSLLGGLFASDATAFGQFMISRPIFCGPVIGLILGDIMTGIYTGMLMELVWIAVVPLGNAVPPDSTVVSVAATYIASSGCSGTDMGFLVFVILVLIPLGIIFKKLDIVHRDFNAFFAHKLEEKLEENKFGYIDSAVYVSLSLFVLKAALFLMVVMFAGERVLPYIYSMGGNSLKLALTRAYYVLPAVGLGTAVTTFVFRKSQQRQ